MGEMSQRKALSLILTIGIRHEMGGGFGVRCPVIDEGCEVPAAFSDVVPLDVDFDDVD